jgi:hypothetical protein
VEVLLLLQALLLELALALQALQALLVEVAPTTTPHFHRPRQRGHRHRRRRRQTRRISPLVSASKEKMPVQARRLLLVVGGQSCDRWHAAALPRGETLDHRRRDRPCQ